MKAVVVGVDGAGWNFLSQPSLRSNGAFGEMASEGISGDLRSTIPPVTGPAWVSFATGCNPGEHGCYGFLTPKDGLSKTSPINSRSIARPTFYEMLEATGKRCVLINLPCSFPPRIRGPVITCLLTVGDRFIFPAGLEDRVPGLRKYRPFPDMALLAKRKLGPYLEDVRTVEKTRFECARELFEGNWDFFFVLFSGIDWALHAIGTGIADAAGNADVRAICNDIGQYLRWFGDNAPKDAWVFAVSDHGFSDYEKPFYINALLAQGGFLHLEASDSLSRPHRLYDDYRSRGVPLRLPRMLVSMAGKSPRFMELVSRPLRSAPIQVTSKTHLMPSSDSAAACLSPGMSRFATVYLNSGLPDEKRTLQEIRDFLVRARDPHTREKVVRQVWTREELYHGKAIGLGPHLIVEAQPQYWVNNDLTYPRVTTKESKVQCNHDLSGIYMVAGQGLVRAVQREASILDLAPTILSAYGMPLPDWMDGKAICSPQSG